MSRLQNKVVLITGAGRGIGRGIALAVAKEGASVAVVEIDPATAESTTKELQALGANALAIPRDIGTREACEAAVAETVEHFGGLDVLVNNAAVSASGVLLKDLDDADFDRTFDVCTKAVFWLMQASRPHLLARGGGSIINFASSAGTLGMPGQGAYAGAKEAVRGLTRTAANEWGPEGIRVNVVCPFANSPGMLSWAAADPKSYDASIARIPLRRVGDCEDDVAPVVVFLASDDARYVTGMTMFVDGGAGSVR